MQRDYYWERKLECIAYLGGMCVRCGTTDDLEFDHINAEEKSFDITSCMNRRWEVLVQELDKCQLLCHFHHREKTVECGEAGGGHNKWGEIVHGTPWGYTSYACRCDPCRAAVAEAKGRPTPSRPYHKRESVHGSKSMYSKYKCRCDICRESQRNRMREYRASRKPA